MRIRHYPVTVSAESHGKDAQRHWRRFREGSHGSMKRKPGDRPCSTTRGGKMHYTLSQIIGDGPNRLPVCCFTRSVIGSRPCGGTRALTRHSKRSAWRDRPRRQCRTAGWNRCREDYNHRSAGNYMFDMPENARYQVRAVAPTFQTTTSESVYLTKSTKADVDITLATQTLTQQVSVTATGLLLRMRRLAPQ